MLKSQEAVLLIFANNFSPKSKESDRKKYTRWVKDVGSQARRNRGLTHRYAESPCAWSGHARDPVQTRHQPVVPQGAYQESPEGPYTLILSDRRNASDGRMHRDHAPPDRTAYAAPRHLDSPRARAAPQPGRPVPPGCPAVPPSCLSDSLQIQTKAQIISGKRIQSFLRLCRLCQSQWASPMPDVRQ